MTWRFTLASEPPRPPLIGPRSCLHYSWLTAFFFFPLWFAWRWVLTRLTGWLIIKISLASDCWGWNLVFYCGGWPLCEHTHQKIKMKYFAWRITPPPSAPPLGDCNYTHAAGGRNVSNRSFRMKKVHLALKKKYWLKNIHAMEIIVIILAKSCNSQHALKLIMYEFIYGEITNSVNQLRRRGSLYKTLSRPFVKFLPQKATRAQKVINSK